ncbi:hypothetical protein TorRG33x02_081380, partial [Trema orientale]
DAHGHRQSPSPELIPQRKSADEEENNRQRCQEGDAVKCRECDVVVSPDVGVCENGGSGDAGVVFAAVEIRVFVVVDRVVLPDTAGRADRGLECHGGDHRSHHHQRIVGLLRQIVLVILFQHDS